METIKTAFVVVLLIAVLFGVYSVLNKPEAAPPKEVAWLEKSGPDALKLDIGTGGDTQRKVPTMDARWHGRNARRTRTIRPVCPPISCSRKPWELGP